MSKKEIAFVEHVHERDVNNILKDRFMRYAKYVIQERAIPDIRDGLKPVQRRILYAMHVENNVFKNPHRKSAKTVGNVIANFHPHGDTSVYDAMVRMSQSWKLNIPLIDMQGNNGSLDDDPAAAMRYTEARLSAIASMLLVNIEKDAVKMEYNFDDTMYEPTVLPTRVPNLLLNGSMGIAIGYATRIPPHNLSELIEAITYRIARPNCSLNEVLEIIKGPDFPTGGLIFGDIRPIYETGTGRITVRARTEIVTNKNENKIIVREIPYEIVKSSLVARMSDACANIDTVVEVRDESGRDTGLQIVVELKQDANPEAVLNYLFRHTELQSNYNFNMVAINNRKPQLFSLLNALDAFIAHQVDVYTNTISFDLSKAERRLHIVEGLIIANSVLDQIIKIIRSSADKATSKINIEARFNLTPIQSEAIVTMQLYRLSRTDVVELEQEAEGLKKDILLYKNLLDDRKKLMRLISKNLTEDNKNFYIPRRSDVINEVATVNVVHEELIAKEDVMVVLTRDGYIKRSNMKSYSQSTGLPSTKVGDIVIGISKVSTLDQLLIFLESGQYVNISVHQLFDCKWKDEGKHLGTIAGIDGQDKVVSMIAVSAFIENINIIMTSANGYIKRSRLIDFAKKSNKASRCFVFSGNDQLKGAVFSDGDSQVLVSLSNGLISKYSENDIPITGIKSGGVKAVNDTLRYGLVVDLHCIKHDDIVEGLILFSEEGGIKLVSNDQLPTSKRLNAPQTVFRSFKSEPQTLLTVIDQKSNNIILLTSAQRLIELDIKDLKPQAFDRILKPSIPLEKNERLVSVSNLYLPFINKDQKTYIVQPIVKKEVKVDEVKEKFENMTIFDFIDE